MTNRCLRQCTPNVSSSTAPLNRPGPLLSFAVAATNECHRWAHRMLFADFGVWVAIDNCIPKGERLTSVYIEAPNREFESPLGAARPTESNKA